MEYNNASLNDYLLYEENVKEEKALKNISHIISHRRVDNYSNISPYPTLSNIKNVFILENSSIWLILTSHYTNFLALAIGILLGYLYTYFNVSWTTLFYLSYPGIVFIYGILWIQIPLIFFHILNTIFQLSEFITFKYVAVSLCLSALAIVEAYYLECIYNRQFYKIDTSALSTSFNNLECSSSNIDRECKKFKETFKFMYSDTDVFKFFYINLQRILLPSYYISVFLNGNIFLISVLGIVFGVTLYNFTEKRIQLKSRQESLKKESEEISASDSHYNINSGIVYEIIFQVSNVLYLFYSYIVLFYPFAIISLLSTSIPYIIKNSLVAPRTPLYLDDFLWNILIFICYILSVFILHIFIVLPIVCCIVKQSNYFISLGKILVIGYLCIKDSQNAYKSGACLVEKSSDFITSFRILYGILRLPNDGTIIYLICSYMFLLNITDSFNISIYVKILSMFLITLCVVSVPPLTNGSLIVILSIITLLLPMNSLFIVGWFIALNKVVEPFISSIDLQSNIWKCILL